MPFVDCWPFLTKRISTNIYGRFELFPFFKQNNHAYCRTRALIEGSPQNVLAIPINLVDLMQSIDCRASGIGIFGANLLMRMKTILAGLVMLIAPILAPASGEQSKEIKLLNVSYDPTRE